MGWRYSRSAAKGRRGGDLCDLIIFVHAAARRRGGTYAFALKIVKTLVTTTYATINLRSPHTINQRPIRVVLGKVHECWWWSWKHQVDPWTRGWEVARLTFSSQTYKEVHFCNLEGMQIFRCLFSTHHRPNVFALGTWPAVESDPEKSAPLSDVTMQSLALPIDVCRGLGISPLRMNHSSGFLWGRSWPNIWSVSVCFSGLFESMELSLKYLSSWRVVRESYGGYTCIWHWNF